MLYLIWFNLQKIVCSLEREEKSKRFLFKFTEISDAIAHNNIWKWRLQLSYNAKYTHIK